jgi:ribosomal protein L24
MKTCEKPGFKPLLQIQLLYRSTPREFPINHSNVMHWSEEKKVRSRIGHKVEDGKKVRFLKKTGEVLAN